MEEIELLFKGMNNRKKERILNLIWSFAGLNTEEDPHFNVFSKKCWHNQNFGAVYGEHYQLITHN